MVPNGWKQTTLDKVLTIGGGKDYKHLEEGSIPVYGSGGYMLSVSDYLYDGESVCIGRKGTIDKPIFLKGKFWTVDTLFYTHSFKDSEPYYIYQFFQTVPWRRLNEASGVPSLAKSIINKVKINLPPLPEQRKIAKILCTWDKAIATTEKLIATSQQQKKALMQQLLTGKKRLVNPETGKVFEGEWEEVRVANFGKVVTGNTPPKGDDSNYGSDISWATAEDFKGKYVGNTKVKLTKSGVSKARLVPKGSVLVTCIASIGKNAIADEDLTTNQQINAVIVNSKHCNEFFYYQIEFNKHKLLAWAGTTAVPILNKSSFEKILLLAPLKHEQQKIASVLTAADKEIELLQAKLAHLKDEKKALMQQLLTGKRRVKVDENVAA